MENFLAFHKNAQASMAIANASIELNTQSFLENSATSSATPLAHTQVGPQKLPAAPYFFRELKNGTVVSIGQPLSVVGNVQKRERKHGRKHDLKDERKTAAAASTDSSSRHDIMEHSSVAEEPGYTQAQAGLGSAGPGRRDAKAIYEAMKIEAIVNSTTPPEDSEPQEQPE